MLVQSVLKPNSGKSLPKNHQANAQSWRFVDKTWQNMIKKTLLQMERMAWRQQNPPSPPQLPSLKRCHHLSPAFFEIASGWSCTNNLGFPRDSHRGPIGKRGLSVAKLAGWAMHTISNAGLTNAEMVQKTSSTEMAKGWPCHCRMQKCGNPNNN